MSLFGVLLSIVEVVCLNKLCVVVAVFAGFAVFSLFHLF
jgi:hypothetical protein